MAGDCEVLVVGSANLDLAVRGERLPRPGETLLGESLHRSVGGKGVNQAVAIARLGVRCAFCGRVGADARGHRVAEALRAAGCDTTELIVDGGSDTGVALIHVDGRGEKQILVAPGANERVSTAQVRASTPAIEAARVVVLQLELPAEVVELVVRLASDAGRRVVLDAGPARPLSDELLSRLDVLRANAQEASFLTGVDVVDAPTAHAAALALLRRGPHAVAIQAGAAGNLLAWKGGERLLPHVPVRVVDATGAGDAFTAGLAVGLAEGRDLVHAAEIATAAAALACARRGALESFPRRAEVDALLGVHA